MVSKIPIVTPRVLWSQKNNFKQCISIVDDGASGEQVGDIEKIIVTNLFKNIISLHEVDESSKKQLL